jgi:hypothetical protein
MNEFMKSRNGMCAVTGGLLIPSPYTNTHTKESSVSTSAFRLRTGVDSTLVRNVLPVIFKMSQGE